MTWLAKADPREAARRERRLGPESLDAGTLSLHDGYKFARAIISQQIKAQIDMELTLSWLELLVLPPSSHTQHVRCCGMRRAATARRRRRGRGRRLTAVG